MSGLSPIDLGWPGLGQGLNIENLRNSSSFDLLTNYLVIQRT
jgi:hypothetical protein